MRKTHFEIPPILITVFTTMCTLQRKSVKPVNQANEKKQIVTVYISSM